MLPPTPLVPLHLISKETYFKTPAGIFDMVPILDVWGNYGRADPGRNVAEGSHSTRNDQGVTEPRARPPGTRHEQPPPTYDA